VAVRSANEVFVMWLMHLFRMLAVLFATYAVLNLLLEIMRRVPCRYADVSVICERRLALRLVGGMSDTLMLRDVERRAEDVNWWMRANGSELERKLNARGLVRNGRTTRGEIDKIVDVMHEMYSGEK